MNWHGKQVGVVGLGISNMELVKYLSRQGALITACDQKPASDLGKNVLETLKLCSATHLGPGYLDHIADLDYVFLTPGMRKDQEQIEAIQRRGYPPLSTEMDLFLRLCNARTIGITGSSGKTTTTTLIGEMLRQAGMLVHVGGNIGQPLINRIDEISAGDWVILELSSFQLELMRRSPHIALVTNVTPNHLDMHTNMAEYTEAKWRILSFQGKGDRAVLNYDDPVSRGLGKGVESKVIYTSRYPVEEASVFVRDGDVFARCELRPSKGDEGEVEKVYSVDDINLLGEHNVENCLMATAAACLAGVDSGAIRTTIRNFTAVEHRLELVGVHKGVAYYNDSIATTPTRTVAALHSFSCRVILIAGGYDKKLPFTPLIEAASGRVKVLVLMGATADKIEEEFRRAIQEGKVQPVEIVRAQSLREAVGLASQKAVPGDVVLLSPACASYDMFTSFVERGKQFRELVRGIAFKVS